MNTELQSHHKVLSRLPEKYHPVKICLHYYDMVKGIDKEFQSLGYNVVSAGEPWNPEFIERFYSILKEAKYALSNTMGSQAYYATDLGVPYGIVGKEPSYNNLNDDNIIKGEYNKFQSLGSYISAKKLFIGLPNELITKEQKQFAREGLGVDYGVGRVKMCLILYKSLLQWLLKIISKNQ